MDNSVKWTDIGTFLVSLVGLLLAYIKTTQWLRLKKKEDAYYVSKRYLDALDGLAEILSKINYEYFYLCPVAGSVVESSEKVLERIMKVEGLTGPVIYDGIRSLVNVRHQLGFWGVSLRDQYVQKYDLMIQYANDILTISFAMNTQLRSLYFDEWKWIENVSASKKMFDEKYEAIMNMLTYQKDDKFEDIFKL